jgi:hypothetical protein
MQIMDESWTVREATKLAKELGNERGREAKALEKARKLAHREAMNDLKKSIWQLKPGNVYMVKALARALGQVPDVFDMASAKCGRTLELSGWSDK